MAFNSNVVMTAPSIIDRNMEHVCVSFVRHVFVRFQDPCVFRPKNAYDLQNYFLHFKLTLFLPSHFSRHGCFHTRSTTWP